MPTRLYIDPRLVERRAVAGIVIVYRRRHRVLVIAGLWKVFTKAGEHGWAAIIPFYNYWCMLRDRRSAGVVAGAVLHPGRQPHHRDHRAVGPGEELRASRAGWFFGLVSCCRFIFYPDARLRRVAVRRPCRPGPVGTGREQRGHARPLARTVKTSGPSSVTAMVCSKCADSAAVRGDHRPAVVQSSVSGPLRVDHRLDREDHAGLERRPGGARPVVRHLGRLVHRRADRVADVLADDGEPGRLGHELDGAADLVEAVALAQLVDPRVQAPLGDLEEARARRRRSPPPPRCTPRRRGSPRRSRRSPPR